MILSKTPVRIEIGGGATDVEPYSSEFGGYVINVSIDKYIRSILSIREDATISIFSSDRSSSYKLKNILHNDSEEYSKDLIKAIIYYLKPNIGIDIYIHGDAPKKAGLGASASLCTSLISGILELQKKTISLNEIAEKAFEVEDKILKNTGGRQDQYTSVHGGFNGLKFLGNSDVRIERLKVSEAFKSKIENNLLLFYTGELHTSGDMVKEQVKSYLEEKNKSKESLDKLKEIAYNMRDSLYSEDFERFGELLTEDFLVKTKFNPLMVTDYMTELNNLVLNNGGIGGRICGAGGGGCMIWLTNPKSREKIKELLSQQPGKIIDYNFVDKGLEISHI